MSSIEETLRRIVREEVRAALAGWQPTEAPAPQEDEWISLRAAAAMLDVAEATLRDWRVDRKGPPAVKFGRLVKYRREDLDQWVAERADTVAP